MMKQWNECDCGGNDDHDDDGGGGRIADHPYLCVTIKRNTKTATTLTNAHNV